MLLLREKTEFLAAISAMEASFVAYHQNIRQLLREFESQIVNYTNTISSSSSQPTTPPNQSPLSLNQSSSISLPLSSLDGHSLAIPSVARSRTAPAQIQIYSSPPQTPPPSTSRHALPSAATNLTKTPFFIPLSLSPQPTEPTFKDLPRNSKLQGLQLQFHCGSSWLFGLKTCNKRGQELSVKAVSTKQDNVAVFGSFKPGHELLLFEILREGLEEEMDRDSHVFVMGEDVGYYGGSYKMNKGLATKGGDLRILHIPIAENSFIGMEIGAAMARLCHIVEGMNMSFLLLAFNQIFNICGMLHYTSGGQFTILIVIRGPGGVGRQLGAEHSQHLESYFTIPGIEMVVGELLNYLAALGLLLHLPSSLLGLIVIAWGNAVVEHKRSSRLFEWNLALYM